MKKQGKLLALFLLMLLMAATTLPTALAAGQAANIPQTYILFDVSSSTANSRETLTSLYKYLFALFETSPYEMNLTICFFDENLREKDEILTIVGGEHKGNTVSKLLADDMFSKKTAVYDSLVAFNQKFITLLSDEEKMNTNIIVFSDMVSTVNTSANTCEAVNRIFSQWIESGMTVKGLIWRESAKEFVFRNSDNVNKKYDIDLNNKMGAYECLFHIYFDIITGGYPENFDFNPQQKSNVPVVVYPNSYEMFIITNNNLTTLKYVDRETGEYKDINATELFPTAEFPDNPPKILVINKQQIDLIGTTFLASSVSDFQVYPIVAPRVVNINIQQNGSSELIRANEATDFIVTYDPQIKLWAQNSSELTAEVTIGKDGTDHPSVFTLEDPSDTHEFLGNKNVFSETGEYNITVRIKDKDNAVLSEFLTTQYVTFSRETSSPSGSGGDSGGGNTVLIVVLIIVGLIIVAGFGFFLANRGKKRSWNL
jgi:hypothetical protein